MSDKKHIDRLFQEKFKDFEAKPSANAWAGIQNKMNQPQEKMNSGVTVLFRIAGLAAALVLLFAIGNFVFNNDKIKNNDATVVDGNNVKDENSEDSFNPGYINNTDSVSGDNKKDIEDKSSIVNTNESLNNTTLVKSSNRSKTNISKSKPRQNKIKTLNSKDGYTNLTSKANGNKLNTIVSNISIANKITTKSSTQDNSNLKKIDVKALSAINKKNNATYNTIVAITYSEKEKEEIELTVTERAKLSNAIEVAVAQMENLNEKENNVNRWSVNANAAPVYYNTLGKGSHINDQFINNPKNGEINTSYGINVGYVLNNKLKVRSGINKLNLSYDTANVIVYENVSTTSNSALSKNINFTTNDEGQKLSVINSSNLFILQVSDVINDNLNSALSQRLSYLEVPLELEYAVVNKRFGINLVGGFSTFILNDNEVVTEVDNRQTKIGEANNINNVSFSANAGIGLDYKFSKSVKFNLEPTFKYQINAYNDTSGDFRPYIIGVYTGISYKF